MPRNAIFEMMLLNLLCKFAPILKADLMDELVQFRATVDQYMNNEALLNEAHSVILHLGGKWQRRYE
jgi:hypothetical protein